MFTLSYADLPHNRNTYPMTPMNQRNLSLWLPFLHRLDAWSSQIQTPKLCHQKIVPELEQLETCY